MLYDMHCHLDFAFDGPAAARRLGPDEGACTATLDPERWRLAVSSFMGCDRARVALGLHPWRAADADFEEQAASFEAFACECAFIGEIGLDFSARRLESAARQREGFSRAVRACMRGDASFAHGIVSIHAVRACDEVVAAFAAAGACEGADERTPASAAGRRLVIHSFNGTSDELHRAVRAGFYFSVGPRMLATKRGRAYVRAIPVDRLLLESDMPSHAGGDFSWEAWHAVADASLATIAESRGCDAASLGRVIARTSRDLLGFSGA